MSKAKDKAVLAEVKQETVEIPAPPAPEAPKEFIQEIDRLALELAKSKRQTALAEAKTALANHDNAELSYKYVVLQIYRKYGLNEQDALNESGEVLRGGAANVPQGQ